MKFVVAQIVVTSHEWYTWKNTQSFHVCRSSVFVYVKLGYYCLLLRDVRVSSRLFELINQKVNVMIERFAVRSTSIWRSAHASYLDIHPV